MQPQVPLYTQMHYLQLHAALLVPVVSPRLSVLSRLHRANPKTRHESEPITTLQGWQLLRQIFPANSVILLPREAGEFRVVTASARLASRMDNAMPLSPKPQAV